MDRTGDIMVSEISQTQKEKLNIFTQGTLQIIRGNDLERGNGPSLTAIKTV
jgi:hypothetical protein